MNEKIIEPGRKARIKKKKSSEIHPNSQESIINHFYPFMV